MFLKTGLITFITVACTYVCMFMEVECETGAHTSSRRETPSSSSCIHVYIHCFYACVFKLPYCNHAHGIKGVLTD